MKNTHIFNLDIKILYGALYKQTLSQVMSSSFQFYYDFVNENNFRKQSLLEK